MEKELYRILGLLRLAYQGIRWTTEDEPSQWALTTAIEKLAALLEGGKE